MTLDRTMIGAIEKAAKEAGYIKPNGTVNKTRLAEGAGMPRERVSEVLNGRNTNPTIDTIQKLAKACGCTISRLIGEE